ncbi:MAG: heme d1 biosynthesis protein NirF [Gammaproteobacteria bacterium]|nr:MAG: heme d1 biosynthesis protein NirF [Gammaproteobacteria bacterium]
MNDFPPLVGENSCRSGIYSANRSRNKFRSYMWIIFLLVFFGQTASAACLTRGTGDLGVVIERASGSVQIVETTGKTALFHVKGLGDLSHASTVFSRDERFAYIFGRDGGLSKIDLLCGKLEKRIVQAGNSIGGAISQDGRLVAVSNYQPGGVKVFDAETLALVADLPAVGDNGKSSKVVGLVDAPGQQFVYTLYDAGEIRIVDMRDPAKPLVREFRQVGRLPYDALITPDGRFYIAGLFGEDGLALLDLWQPDDGVRRILDNYGRGKEKLPVYKMPHLEGWATAGHYVFLPAVGQHEVLVVDSVNWQEAGHIAVYGQPVFVEARPDGRHVWVNFAHPRNDTVQVIDARTLAIIKTLKPGKGVLHMEFTPRGEAVWVSVRDSDVVQVYDTRTFERIAELPAAKPSGIFFTARAHRTGL